MNTTRKNQRNRNSTKDIRTDNRMQVKCAAVDDSFDSTRPRKRDKIRRHKTCKFLRACFGQMLSVATYIAAVKVRIRLRIIKRHHKTWRSIVFNSDINLGRVWCDEKNWCCSNISDFLRTFAISDESIK